MLKQDKKTNQQNKLNWKTKPFEFPPDLVKNFSPMPPSLATGLLAPKPFRSRYQEAGFWLKAVFIFFLLIFSVTFFTKDRFKSVNQFSPQTLQAPIQTAITNPEPIVFTQDGFSYKLTPLYDYDLSGLLVSTFNYNSWYSLSRTDEVFARDWCLVWGSNVGGRVFQDSSVRISQDARWCRFRGAGAHNFSGNELSNNHLLAKNSIIQKLIEKVSPGDQVRIKGKLVNVEAQVVGTPKKYESSQISWHTSVTRSDTGVGACEVIYVESVEVLKRGNVFSHFLFSLSKYVLIVMVLWAIANFVFSLKPSPQGKRT